MFQVARNTLVLIVTLCSIAVNVHAIDRYQVDVKAHHYPWLNISTYDIDVRRTGLRRINPGQSVEARLANTPIGGNLSKTLRRRSASRRDTAEANLLNAQAELLRFQLREAKKQSRQRKESVADVATALIFANLNNVDFETAGIRYLRNGGDPTILSAAFADIAHKAQAIKAREVKREPLSRVLNLNNAQTQRAYRTLQYYETKYKLTRAQAITKFLTLRRGLSPAEANSCLKRIRY